jgi:hypothetical protein
MKSKLFLEGMFGILLTFGLVLAGCDNGTTGGGSSGGGDDPVEKSLLITGSTQAQVTAAGGAAPRVGIFKAGTTTAQAQAQPPIGYVAGADGSIGDFSLSKAPEPYTATALLYDADGNRWTGSGTYDIFFQFGDTGLTKKNVSFNNASTSIAAGSFTTP